MRWCILLVFVLYSGIFLSGQDRDRAFRDVDTLAGDGMFGRGYVNNGANLAAQYLARRFEEIGLLPAGTEGYFQKYAFNVNTFPESSKIVFGKTSLQEGYDFIIDPRSGRSKGKYATAVFDSSSFTPESNTPKPGKKIPVIFMEGITDPDEVARQHEFMMKAIQSGPVILVRPEKLTWSVGQKTYPNAVIEVLKQSLPKEKEKVSLAIEPEEILFEASNVIGKVKGRRSDSLIVITAHFDHLGMMGEAIFPGASDNASGTAFLLDLAHHYADHQPEFDTYFIGFSGEEAGLIGSHYFVENPVFELDKVKFLVNLDLMGSAEKGITIVNGRLYEELMSKMAAINSEKDLLPKIKLRGKAANSDHYWFSEKGVPAIFIYTEGNIKAYHDVYDTPEVIDWANYEEVFTLLVEFLKVI